MMSKNGEFGLWIFSLAVAFFIGVFAGATALSTRCSYGYEPHYTQPQIPRDRKEVIKLYTGPTQRPTTTFTQPSKPIKSVKPRVK